MTCLRRHVKELSQSFLRGPARGIPLSINRRGVACIHQTPLTGRKAFVDAACSPFRDRSNPTHSFQLRPKRRLVPTRFTLLVGCPQRFFGVFPNAKPAVLERLAAPPSTALLGQLPQQVGNLRRRRHVERRVRLVPAAESVSCAGRWWPSKTAPRCRRRSDSHGGHKSQSCIDNGARPHGTPEHKRDQTATRAYATPCRAQRPVGQEQVPTKRTVICRSAQLGRPQLKRPAGMASKRVGAKGGRGRDGYAADTAALRQPCAAVAGHDVAGFTRQGHCQQERIVRVVRPDVLRKDRQSTEHDRASLAVDHRVNAVRRQNCSELGAATCAP